MDVTDVLRDRRQETTGFERMLTLSIVVHVALVAALVVAPGGWFAPPADEVKPVMTISLGGGGDAPRNGGMTAMGGRPVQVQTPPDEPKRPEAVRPPAAKAPEMTLPTPNAKPAKAASSKVTEAPDDARGRTPTKGAETSAGSATAVTGARGQGFGLSSGGGPGAGATLDVADFCCPDYLTTVIDRITANWNQRQNVGGLTTVRVTIRRDGTLAEPVIEQSSGSTVLDLEAKRAIVLSMLPPLPNAFPNPTLTVHFTFQYQR